MCRYQLGEEKWKERKNGNMRFPLLIEKKNWINYVENNQYTNPGTYPII